MSALELVGVAALALVAIWVLEAVLFVVSYRATKKDGAR